MNAAPLQTQRLELVPNTPEDVRAEIAALPPEQRVHVSAAWLALFHATTTVDPWVLGFRLVLRATGMAIGVCGYKGPPDAHGIVEIAYGVSPEHQGHGYATEAVAALVAYAFNSTLVHTVRAHTLPAANASTRVLTKCGFQHLGEVLDPEDGPVWRWEKCRGTK